MSMSPKLVRASSGARVGLLLPVDTVKLRGSQKSTSCSEEEMERAYCGVGEGDSEGQEVVDWRSLELWCSDGGCDARYTVRAPALAHEKAPQFYFLLR